jgi:peptidoglycan/LPS O-acetylase OafA/YrhL
MLRQTASGSARFEALDALRGICALLVALFHVPIYHMFKDSHAFANLQFCVDMFFVLSGFVLCHAYGQRLRDGKEGIRFVVMRFARLWPLHIVMLLACVPVELSKIVVGHADASMVLDSRPFGPAYTLWEAVTNILFLQSFGLHSAMSWNGVAWSAALEFWVSILFAVIVLLFPRRRYDVFLGLCVAAGLLLYLVSPDNLFVSFDWGVLRAVYGFFAGCLVYDLRMRSSGRLVVPSVLEVLCLALAASFALTAPSGGSQYLFPLAAIIVIYVFSFEQGIVSAALRSSGLQKLGLWSYSIYMIHPFIFQVTKMTASFIGHKTGLHLVGWHNGDKLMLLGSPGQALLPALVLLMLVIPFAALTYRWIEKPALDAVRSGITSPPSWQDAVSATGVLARLHLRARSRAFSAGRSIAHGLDALLASSRRSGAGIQT